MRNVLLFFLAALLVTRAAAQSNAAVRLAVIAETGEASATSDILTAELSKNSQVILLDRNEIDRVYREQGLSAGNQDFLKLGQILGADGVLLVSAIANTNETGLRLRLIAVKPGVVLASERFSMPADLSRWASGVAMRLEPVLPKLSVLVQDAVPVSVVNFRSAIQSPETKEAERQMTSLAIERLTREQQLFVLERTRMQMLTAEKELKGLNDSVFWNGSYLLEGTLDRDGYSPGKITISARLVPPKGGAPVSIEVSGSRTNFPEVINQLADKVRTSLKLAATASPWNPTDEAQKYFEEAQWALKWGLLEQAQSASDSAWALGKQDLECALVHIDAYLKDVPDVDPLDDRTRMYVPGSGKFVTVQAIPAVEEIDRALHALSSYDEFSRKLPLGEPKVNSPYYVLGIDVLEKATGVLRHFHFHPEAQGPVSEKLADARSLARSVAAWISKSPSVRDTYSLISSNGGSPDSTKIAFQFPERTRTTYNRLENFAECEADWGCFWQDRPEDCVTVYRSLMTNSLFIYIEKKVWFRDRSIPRLTAWNQEDRNRVPEVWRNFLRELEGADDGFLRVQAKALQFADAIADRNNAEQMPWTVAWTNREAWSELEKLHPDQDKKIETTFEDLFTLLVNKYDKILTDRPELAYLDWKLDGFFNRSIAQTETTGKISNEYQTKYAPQIGKLRSDFVIREKKRRDDAVALVKKQEKEKAEAEALSAQKQYLTNFTHFEIHSFSKVFPDSRYSKEQAAELKPLVDAYRSNVLAHASPTTKMRDDSDLSAINFFLGRRLDEALNTKPPSQLTTVAATPSTNAAAPVMTVAVAAPTTNTVVGLDPLTNVIVAKNFLHFPEDQFPDGPVRGLVVLSHRLRNGQLFLDARYRASTLVQDGEHSTHQVESTREAALQWNPAGNWQIIPYPHSEQDLIVGSDLFAGAMGGAVAPTLFVEMLNGALYVSDRDAIRKYDLKQQKWEELPLPGQYRAQLFAANNHLYAASPETIWEILDGGASSRILASVRRRPATSILDSRDTLGRPVLFEGKGNSLYAALDGEVFSWNGNDWNRVTTIEGSDTPEVFGTTALFRRNAGDQLEFWRLEANQLKPTLCWRERGKALPPRMSFGGFPGMMPTQVAHAAAAATVDRSIAPLWKCPFGFELGRAPAAMDESNIYFFVERSDFQHGGTSSSRPVERRGRHAELICLKNGFSEPLIVPIRFLAEANFIPVEERRMTPAWMDCTSEYLFIGHNGVPGVWALPKAEIEAEIERQYHERQSAIESGKKSLFAKYDLNHNGLFDPDEREAAIDDPAFLQFEIESIDSSNDGLLEAEELSYFDANKNGTLDPAEEAGIRTAEGILAARLLKAFDRNENGKLDWNETRQFLWENYTGTFQNGGADVQKVQQFLDSTLVGLLSGQTLDRGPNPVGGATYPASFGLPWKTSFKQKVENYWARQKSASPVKPQSVEN